MVKFIPPKKQKSYLAAPKSLLAGARKKLSFLKWVDPFTYVDLFVMPQVKKVSDSEILEFIVNVVFAFVFAAAIYTILGAILQTSTPLVIVYSASMEPTMHRGDVVLLKSANDPIFPERNVTVNYAVGSLSTNNFVKSSYDSSGELSSFVIDNNQIDYKKDGPIVVYSAYNPLYPAYDGKQIIHRAIVQINATDGEFILTKGDNSATNKRFDQELGLTLYPSAVKNLQGQVVVSVPLLGCIKLWLVDDFSSIISKGHLPSDFEGIC
ncbi:Uncharacterised protein [uncultured archaeon]|nr:Uncharacterised protein [uncultured archaeon]